MKISVVIEKLPNNHGDLLWFVNVVASKGWSKQAKASRMVADGRHSEEEVVSAPSVRDTIDQLTRQVIDQLLKEGE